MSHWLKQSTATTVKIGPFVDSGDGVTAETSLTISQADIRISKNGGAFAQTNNATGATHDENGYYGVPLDTTDTNTLGRLKVCVSESGALPVWADYMVLPANVWDSLFGSDKLQVDVAEWLGTAAATPTVAGVPEVDVTHWKGSAAPDNTGDAFARLGAPAGASVSADIAAIEAQTDDIGVAGAGLTAIPWNAAWDAEVQSEVADALGVYDPPTHAELTTATANLDAAVSSRSTLTQAQVNTEVVDVIRVDTISELAQAAPAATPTVATALMLLYMALRNESERTSSELKIKNDAGTVICKGSLADDGTTFTKGELAAGP